MTEQHFTLPVAATLRLQARSGGISVTAEPRDDVAIDGDRAKGGLDDDGRTLLIRSGHAGSKSMSVRCPVGTDVKVGTQSGSVTLDGRFGDVRVTTMSGKIQVDAAERADLRTMSGSLSVATCDGSCRMSAVSGSITGGDVDHAAAQTISGAMKFERVRGAFRARTVNGSIDVRAGGEGDIAVKTVAGSVRIALPAGTAIVPCINTRGSVRCLLPEGDDCRVDAVSLSGSIDVVPL